MRRRELLINKEYIPSGDTRLIAWYDCLNPKTKTCGGELQYDWNLYYFWPSASCNIKSLKNYNCTFDTNGDGALVISGVASGYSANIYDGYDTYAGQNRGVYNATRCFFVKKTFDGSKTYFMTTKRYTSGSAFYRYKFLH